jgi:hypothetical protein
LKKATHGGSRAGSGRKAGSKWQITLEKQAAAQLYREEVLARMGPLVKAQIDAASGLYAKVAVAEVTDKGVQLRRVTSDAEIDALVTSGRGARVFLADPDMTISKYLTDQVIGKPTESVEVSGPKGGPVRVEFVIVDAHA